jgi:nitrate/nitrite transport system ATP-binding protein
MSNFVEVDHIDRVFTLPEGGKYIALKNIELKIKKGEFVSLIGHSGCGKSTLLNLIAGLDRPTQGGVILEGKQVTEPGPDRMVVFQNYSLLPWLTVKENISLAVDEVYGNKPKGERKGIVEHHIDLVGLRHATNKLPDELSGGMKQRVAIARALAIRPKLLLLDEPFGALDALTRGSLQDQLMKICEESHLTCVMVTHDVDEALLLSDRIVMLTNGPESHIGQILEVDIPRPRHRLEVVNHPNYYPLRNQMIYFLNQQKKAKLRQKRQVAAVVSKGIEKTNLNIGFVPTTDSAPLIVAKETGLFAKYGLEVTLSKEISWKAIAAGVATGKLDAAQMVAGMPLSLTLGAYNKPPVPIVTALTLSRNGNAITLSKELYNQGVRTLADFKAAIEQNKDPIYKLGVVYPSSMQNLMLRYWLASGGIDPDRDVSVNIVSPSEMVEHLRSGDLDGYCVGEPWNSVAVNEDLGFVIASDRQLWWGHPEKVLGVREEWVNQNHQTHTALIKASIEACQYCDDSRNQDEILALLSKEEYLGLSAAYTGKFELPSAKIKRWGYNHFYTDKSNYPDPEEGLWLLTQMARWGIIPFPKNWVTILERVRRIDLFGEAARELGILDIGHDRRPIEMFDDTIFDPDDPLEYLNSLKIKREIQIEEIDIDIATTQAA